MFFLLFSLSALSFPTSFSSLPPTLFSVSKWLTWFGRDDVERSNSGYSSCLESSLHPSRSCSQPGIIAVVSAAWVQTTRTPDRRLEGGWTEESGWLLSLWGPSGWLCPPDRTSLFCQARVWPHLSPCFPRLATVPPPHSFGHQGSHDSILGGPHSIPHGFQFPPPPISL